MSIQVLGTWTGSRLDGQSVGKDLTDFWTFLTELDLNMLTLLTIEDKSYDFCRHRGSTLPQFGFAVFEHSTASLDLCSGPYSVDSSFFSL